MTDDQLAPSFAVDLITFADPTTWGCGHPGELRALGRREPRDLWTRLLDMVQASGATGIELTFEPLGWRTSTAAFGGPDGLRHELERRGLHVVSGYFGDLETPALLQEAERGDVAERAAAYADFLLGCGASLLLGSLPLRLPAATAPAIRRAFTTAVVDGVHEVALSVQSRGCRLALHTESHSAFWTGEDVDCYLDLLDPDLVGLCPDTAHLWLGGSDPVAVVRRHRDRIALVHWKDARGSLPLDPPDVDDVFATHQPHFCPLGSGEVDLAALITELDDTDLMSTVLLEVDEAADPVDAIQQSVFTFTRALTRA